MQYALIIYIKDYWKKVEIEGTDMDKTEKRSPIRNLVYIFIHWLLVVILSVISFYLQYAFMKDTGEESFDYIFSGKVYNFNYVTFSLGVVIFVVGFHIIRKKFLITGWFDFDGQFWMWKAGYVMISLIAMGAISVAGILIPFMHLGLGSIVKPEWLSYGFFAFPAYVLLAMVIHICMKRKTAI